MRANQLLPFLAWQRPSRGMLGRDVIAGVSVGVVLIPQALAYATLAGMPPYTGLYAAFLPCIVGALWGSSSLLAVGPVALTSLLTFASLKQFAIPGTEHWIALAVWVALLSGAVQVLLGVCRLGVLGNLISYPVLNGFINAAAILIILSQLPALVGTVGSSPIAFITALVKGDFLHATTVMQTSAFGMGAVLLLALHRRLAPKTPGVMLICVVAIVTSTLVPESVRHFQVVGTIPSGLPTIGLPPLVYVQELLHLCVPAIIVALVSFTEAMSSCRILSKGRGDVWNEDQELVGQGLAKIASAVSGAFPVSGSFSRSALNRYVGAETAWSSIFSAICVALFLLLGTALLEPLPLAVLAAIIIVPTFGLVRPASLLAVARASKVDGFIGIATFCVTLAAAPNIYWGVLVGLSLSLAALVFDRVRPRILELSLDKDGSLVELDSSGGACLNESKEKILILRIESALVFLCASVLSKYVSQRLATSPSIRAVLLDCRAINVIDVTGVEALKDIASALLPEKIPFLLSAVNSHVLQELIRHGVANLKNVEIHSTTLGGATRVLQKL